MKGFFKSFIPPLHDELVFYDMIIVTLAFAKRDHFTHYLQQNKNIQK